MADPALATTVELSTHTPETFGALYGALRGVHGIKTAVAPPHFEPGDQGSVVDLLTVSCASGGAVAVLLDIVRNLVEARRPGFSLTVRQGTATLEITADTVEDALPLLEELLDGS
ncbi:hypothetical protein RVR_8863 [Actinacidiphila reveromycinica]|uniref:Uncharacterized protein n=1 Tax=Actinacidiphila reveromycinica TaxID=659352 RepID=A0A7U3UZ07_9ACTN|nr:hypothetical protein [Streptomyces sp. SN-593]BBB01442.1 hypothetical protein RVR_8863 [Streptomyces sp. SN-593]